MVTAETDDLLKDCLFLLYGSETNLGAQNQISLHLQDKNTKFLFLSKHGGHNYDY
jgi:hypothetical protein